MSTTSTKPTLTADLTVGEIVAAWPTLARVFEQLKVDYCCGGKRALRQVCTELRLDPVSVVALLQASVDALASAAGSELDVSAYSLTELADHIERTHHNYVKAELPRLCEMADRVARKHSWRDERLVDVAETTLALAAEMFSHMDKEEKILFPLVRQIERGASDKFHCGSIANPIRQMETEHESAGQAVARLRELTDGFAPAEDACNTHRALLAGLAEFESDLHRHVHKENNILFPRALQVAGNN